MKPQEMLNKIGTLLDDARTAVLVTVDKEGRSHARWMTPVVVRQRPGVIYAFAAVGSHKLSQIEANGRAEWLIQSKDLREVVDATGVIRIVDNPSLKAELMDILGPLLTVFWKANPDKEEFVVLETVLQAVDYLAPMEGRRLSVIFGPEKK